MHLSRNERGKTQGSFRREFKMTKQEFETFQADLAQRLAQLESPEEFETITGDEAEQSQLEKDFKLQAKILGRNRHLYWKIQKALKKLEHGTYGQCEDCDGDIEKKRLQARPFVNRCLGCQEMLEKEENNMSYLHRSATEKEATQIKMVGLKEVIEEGLQEKQLLETAQMLLDHGKVKVG
jgi:RNA polymerase-binding protein DksA